MPINGTPGPDTLAGGIGNDEIYGFGGNDYLSGGDGSDTINGGEGDDYLDGGLSNDTLIGGEGNDSLVDNYGVNVFDGGDGDDTISANNGAAGQWVSAGAGNDWVYSNRDNLTALLGDGDDHVLIAGGTGVILSGEAGSDIYQIYPSSSVAITDFAVGQGGDVIDISYILQYVSGYNGPNPFATGHLRLLQSGADTLVQVDGNGAGGGASFTTFVTLTGITAANITAFNLGGYNPDGSPGAGEVINGTPVSDALVGTIGADEIYGLDGSDYIIGGDGSDIIDGGEGVIRTISDLTAHFSE